MSIKDLIKKLLFLSLIIAGSYDALYSQKPNLHFSHITEANGLMNPNVHWIYQDSKEFMWIGTEDGLFSYDGYKFRKYYSIEADSISISPGYIRTITGTPEGNIWIGSTAGLDYYDRDKDNFTLHSHDSKNSGSLSADDVMSIAIDSCSNLWLATTTGGLNYYVVKENRFIHFNNNSKDSLSLVSDRLMKVYLDKQQRLWIGSWEGVMDLFDQKNNRFIHFHLKDQKSNSPNTDQIRDIIQDRRGIIWIATAGSGLFRMHEKTRNNYTIKNYIHDPANPLSISNDHVSQIIENNSGGLWIGTENGGLNYLDTNETEFYHYYYNELDKESLSHNSVWSLYQDKSGNLWVGTFTSGLNLNKATRSGFRTYKNIPGDVKSLSSNTVSCFFEDRQGNIWIGTDGGGLNKFNKNDESFERFNTKNSNLSSDAVLCVYEDSRNNLWVGTWEGGLNLFNRKNGTFTKFTRENSGLGCNNIISIVEDRHGILWVGTFWGDGGISRFDEKNKRFITYKTENSQLPHNTIYSIINGLNNDLYIGTADGLCIFNPAKNSFKTYRMEDNNPNSIGNNTIVSLLLASDSILWVGTAGGIDKFNIASGVIRRYNMKDGLANNQVSGIEEDRNGNLWIATGNGLSMLDHATGVFRTYDVTDGLQGNSFFRCSHFKSSNGELYFGGTKGFNVFDPKDLKELKIKPPVYLTGFRVFNQPVNLNSKYSPLKKQISEADEVRLHYNQSVITFEFAAIYYASPEKIKYEYKLEGFDKNWNPVRDERSATYTNLNPGKYTFKVRVPCNNGICNEQGTSIRVVIIPPFWMRWWFRILLVLALAVILMVIYAFRVRSIKSTNRMLERMVDERTRELKQKNEIMKRQSNELNETNTLLEERQQQIEEQTEVLIAQKAELESFNEELHELNATKDKFISIIAHDIKNPFNSIIGFSELLMHNFNKWTEEKKLQILQVIFDSSQGLYELLENLLQWSRSQGGMIEFYPIETDLNQQIIVAVTLLKDSAESKKIKILTDFKESQIILNADLRMLDTIFRNILSNAIKFTSSNGIIQITTKIEDNFAVAEFKDNGVGMTDEVISKLFRIDSHHTTIGTNNEKGTGLGLILVKEFVSKHNGSIKVESVVGEGSTFCIKFPLDHKGI